MVELSNEEYQDYLNWKKEKLSESEKCELELNEMEGFRLVSVFNVPDLGIFILCKDKNSFFGHGYLGYLMTEDKIIHSIRSSNSRSHVSVVIPYENEELNFMTKLEVPFKMTVHVNKEKIECEELSVFDIIKLQ